LLDVATTIAILVAVGLGAGTLGSMLGVGGGILMVPALTLLGLPPAQAAGTSLFAVASTSVSSTVAYSRQKRIDYRLGIEMAASAIPGAVVGGFVSTQITAPDFKLYFGILLMAVGGYIAFRDSILKEKESHRVSAFQHAAVFAITFGAGIISSLFGVGGGVIFVPVMLLIHRMTMHRAVPTSQLTLMLTARSRCMRPKRRGFSVAKEVTSRRLGLTSGRQSHSPSKPPAGNHQRVPASAVTPGTAASARNSRPEPLSPAGRASLPAR
jgi:hypothetical protein